MSAGTLKNVRKKRQKMGRLTDVMKKIRLQSHEVGEDCRCKKLKCSEHVSAQESGPLCKETNHYNGASYRYKVRAKRADAVEDLNVCHKDFISFHGTTSRKLNYVKASLRNTGLSPVDKRGETSSNNWHLRDDMIYRIWLRNIFRRFEDGRVKSYDTYCKILSRKFNISFGYLRTGTCSMCDEFNVKVKSLRHVTDSKELQELTTEKELLKP
ncbi:hypothetical protein PR048_009647 [Dryococelus australis]|uniref:Uncharacterized protein n=1 Tax=Dryococelus australis TaxID=614101 RepID=A0ABQ9I1I5_9NEOP|nr:hypothetical protein PR048_009647 [Dryococelus australis]